MRYHMMWHDVMWNELEVRQHQWFLHKLPAYLALPPEMIELQERHMDQEIVLKGETNLIMNDRLASLYCQP